MYPRRDRPGKTGSREEFLSCRVEEDGLSEGELILEQSAIPSPGVPSVPPENAFLARLPPRKAALLGEKVNFFFFPILNPSQFVKPKSEKNDIYI